MAKSSYLSFEISGHSGIISSCGAFVQRCRQGLQTRACIAVGQTLRGADVHPVQQVNSELARWGIGNDMLKLASFTGKHRNDSGHVATHNNCDANQGHRETGKK